MSDGLYRTDKSFSAAPTVIRAGGLLTTSYVLCNSHATSGDIDVSDAARVSFWISCSLGSTPATSLELKPVFCSFVRPTMVPVSTPIGTNNVLTGTHEGADIYLGDLASTAGTKIVTTATGTPFAAWMVGHYLLIQSGTNFTPGRYLIVGFNSTTSLDVAVDPTTGGNGSSGIGGIDVEFQELAMSTASGTTTLFPHVYTFPATSLTGAGTDDQHGVRGIYTVPIPAAKVMRVYAKVTDTATASGLWLGVTKMPPNGA